MDDKRSTATPESRIIKAAIDAAGITKAAIAENLDVQPAMVSQWASGKRPVAAKHAYKLGRMIRCRPEEISVAYREEMDRQVAVNGPSVHTHPEMFAVRGTGGEPTWLTDPPNFVHPEQMAAETLELRFRRLENDVHALNLALGMLVSVMVEHRPIEAQGAADALRRRIPAQFRDKGLIHELISALERSRA